MEIDYSLINEANRSIRDINWDLYAINKSVRLEDNMKRTYLKHKLNVLMTLVAHTRNRAHLANHSLEQQEAFLKEHKSDWIYLKRLLIQKKRESVMVEMPTQSKENLEKKKKITFLDRIKDLF